MLRPPWSGFTNHMTALRKLFHLAVEWGVLDRAPLVMLGVSIMAVKELLDRESIEMTLQYAHLSPDMKREAVQRLDIEGVRGAEGEREITQ